MRVLLIHPGIPAYGGMETYRAFYPPIGLAAIAAPLRDAGHDVAIVDMSVMGLDEAGVVAYATNFRADVAGFRCQFINYPLGLSSAAAIKAALPDCRTIFGGPHMGLVGEQAVRDHPCVDAVVHGEGETALLEYVTALAAGVRPDSVAGLIWRDPDDGSAVRNQQREVKRGYLQYPPPAIELLPMHLYRVMNFFTLEGHRGCPMRCTFCSLPAVQTRRVRYKEPTALVDEMDRLVHEFGINRFEFVEVNFTIHKGWAKEVCELIGRRKLNVHWICRSYPELVDRPTLEAMVAAGCYRIYFGIESGSADVLKGFNKITTVEQGRQAIELAKSVGLQVYCDFMVGGPNESAETVEETISFIRDTEPDYSDISLVVPFPGTPLYDRPEDFGLRVLEERWYERPEIVSQFPYVRVMESETLPLRDLERLWVHAVTEVNYGEVQG